MISFPSTSAASLVLVPCVHSFSSLIDGSIDLGRWGASPAGIVAYREYDVSDRRRRPLVASSAPWRDQQLCRAMAEDDDDVGGVPIFDSNERATLFGLEPKAGGVPDPLDNGLQFTGPIVMIISVFVTLSLFFGDVDGRNKAIAPTIDPNVSNGYVISWGEASPINGYF
jgi:hypothetical protein